MALTVERFKTKSEIVVREEDAPLWREWGFDGIKQSQHNEQICRWNLPDPNWVKLNFDGSKEFDTLDAGAGFVVRNDIG